MIYFKLLITMYLYFLGLVAICYISKKILEVVEYAHKKRIENFKQYGNRK